MQYIKLIEDSDAIGDEQFKELYLSQFPYILKTLSYFEKKGIEATIIIHGKEEEDGLHTFIEVQCEDEVFKKIIESSINRFNN